MPLPQRFECVFAKSPVILNSARIPGGPIHADPSQLVVEATALSSNPAFPIASDIQVSGWGALGVILRPCLLA